MVSKVTACSFGLQSWTLPCDQRLTADGFFSPCCCSAMKSMSWLFQVYKGPFVEGVSTLCGMGRFQEVVSIQLCVFLTWWKKEKERNNLEPLVMWNHVVSWMFPMRLKKYNVSFINPTIVCFLDPGISYLSYRNTHSVYVVMLSGFVGFVFVCFWFHHIGTWWILENGCDFAFEG